LSYHLVLREDRRNFEEQIKFFTDNYKVCSVAEVLSAAKSETDNGEYHIAVTFDDGFRVLMSYCLEALEKFGIKALFTYRQDL
jgi:peptidoglycan/xylan/chitin deacetylase (PgdA/CDA1 family)